MISSLYYHAVLDSVAKGFLVFPYHLTRGKTPLEKNWPLQLRCTKREVYDFWHNRDNGFGISTADLLIVDIDGSKAQANYRRLLEVLGISNPESYVIRSGNSNPDHYHMIFKLPKGMRVRFRGALKNIPGFDEFDKIDIKSGIAHQIVGPGNLHKHGEQYYWDYSINLGVQNLGEPESVDDLTEPPAALIEALGGLIKDEYFTKEEKTEMRLIQKAKRDLAEASKKKDKKKLKKVLAAGESDSEFKGFEDSSRRGILLRLKSRAEILGTGVRHSVCRDQVCYLMGTRNMPVEETIDVMEDFLTLYQDEYEAALGDAIEDMRRLVYSLQDKIETGEFEEGIHHVQIAVDQELCDKYGEFLDSIETENEIERAYVESVLLLSQYSIWYHQDPVQIRMTDRQIAEAMTLGYGLNLSKRAFYNLKDKFSGGLKRRGDNRAPNIELVKCVRVSRSQQEPSLYRPSVIPTISLEDLYLPEIEIGSNLYAGWGKPMPSTHTLEDHKNDDGFMEVFDILEGPQKAKEAAESTAETIRETIQEKPKKCRAIKEARLAEIRSMLDDIAIQRPHVFKDRVFEDQELTHLAKNPAFQGIMGDEHPIVILNPRFQAIYGNIASDRSNGLEYHLRP